MANNMKPLEEKLAEAQRKIANAVKQQSKATDQVSASDKTLYGALQTVRELGDLLKDDEDLQKAFLADREYVDKTGKKKKVGYGKPVRRNFYVGLVKLAFTNTGKSSLSQYAKVLKLAAQDEPDPTKFTEWLDGDHETGDGKHSGIKGALIRAKVELLTPEERKAREAKSKAEHDAALAHFLGNATKIKAPQITQLKGVARALVYFDKKESVLYVDEYNAATDQRSVASAIKVWKVGSKA